MNLASLDDPELIPFIDLDADDFAGLFLGMKQMLHANIYHSVRNHHDTEDICQETAMRGWLYRLSLMEKKSFPSWICRIAANTVKRFGSWKIAEKRALERYAQQHSFREQGHRILPEIDPLSVCLANELKEIMMGSLPEKCSELCYLFSFEGLSPGELAKKFSMSENTIRYRLKKSGLHLNSMGLLNDTFAGEDP